MTWAEIHRKIEKSDVLLCNAMKAPTRVAKTSTFWVLIGTKILKTPQCPWKDKHYCVTPTYATMNIGCYFCLEKFVTFYPWLHINIGNHNPTRVCFPCDGGYICWIFSPRSKHEHSYTYFELEMLVSCWADSSHPLQYSHTVDIKTSNSTPGQRCQF